MHDSFDNKWYLLEFDVMNLRSCHPLLLISFDRGAHLGDIIVCFFRVSSTLGDTRFLVNHVIRTFLAQLAFVHDAFRLILTC